MNTNKTGKDKSGNWESHWFLLQMLEAKLSGNHIKVMLAYLNVGGFDPRRDVFLCRKDYERFGMVRQTVSRLRQDLIEAGWLVPTDKKTRDDYEYFNVQVGGGVTKRDKGSHIMSQGVSSSETAGDSFQDTEVTKVITREVTKNEQVKSSTSALRAPVEPNAGASDSNSNQKNVRDKENSELPYSLDSLNEVTPIVVYLDEEPEVQNKGVSQKTTASGRTLTETGELDW